MRKFPYGGFLIFILCFSNPAYSMIFTEKSYYKNN